MGDVGAQEHPFLSTWSSDQVEKILDSALVIDLKAGDIVFDAGSVSEGVYLIEVGQVSLQNEISGTWVEMDRRDPGDLFGEVSFLAGRTHHVRAVAYSPCRVLMLASEVMRGILAPMPAPVQYLLQSVIDHVGRTSTSLAEISFQQEKLAVVGRMANSIVHDFKSPFQMIGLGAEMIDRISHDKSVHRLCTNISAQVSRMLAMANELGEFSRGQEAYHFNRASLAELLAAVIDEQADTLRERGIEVRCDIDAIELEMDADRMHRVFQNLLTNAIEAMKSRPGFVEFKALLAEDGFVEIRVSDNGPGIPEGIRETFWEPFVTEGKTHGIGLGTSIVKNVVEGHGGTVDFETHLGEGTTFILRLPRTR